jgi:hypothetical protein
MENETLTNSLHVRSPKFNCYQTIEAEDLNINSENSSPVFKLFSKKCQSENKCLVVECPVNADLKNKHI